MSKNAPKDIKDRDPAKVAFGARLRTIREQKSLTQAQLGAMIGLSENAIVQYETGRASPRKERIQRLTEVLQVSANYLLTGGDPEEEVKAQTRPELEALRIIRDIPPGRQDAVIAALRAMAGAMGEQK